MVRFKINSISVSFFIMWPCCVRVCAMLYVFLESFMYMCLCVPVKTYVQSHLMVQWVNGKIKVLHLSVFIFVVVTTSPPTSVMIVIMVIVILIMSIIMIIF